MADKMTVWMQCGSQPTTLKPAIVGKRIEEPKE